MANAARSKAEASSAVNASTGNLVIVSARIAATRPSRSERLPWRLSIASMAARPSTAGPSSSSSRVRPGARMAVR